MIDFANAETTDEACLKHFENMQEFMVFSPDFAERTKTEFPWLSSIHLPEATGIDQFKELLEETYTRVIGEIKTELLYEQNIHVVGWVPTAKVLWLSTVDADGHHTGKFDLHTHRKEYLVKQRPEFFSALACPPLSDSIDELDNIFDCWINVWTHCRLRDLQKDLRAIFDKILRDKSLDDIPELAECIVSYNELSTSRVVNRGYSLGREPPIEEANYVRKNPPPPIYPYYLSTNWTRAIQRDLVYCLVEFLMTEGNQNYLGKCLNCSRYFISTRVNRQNPQKFCRYNGDACRHEWNNKRRVKSGEAARYVKIGRLEGKYQ